jgi:hypothetical protein
MNEVFSMWIEKHKRIIESVDLDWDERPSWMLERLVDNRPSVQHEDLSSI